MPQKKSTDTYDYCAVFKFLDSTKEDHSQWLPFVLKAPPVYIVSTSLAHINRSHHIDAAILPRLLARLNGAHPEDVSPVFGMVEWLLRYPQFYVEQSNEVRQILEGAVLQEVNRGNCLGMMHHMLDQCTDMFTTAVRAKKKIAVLPEAYIRSHYGDARHCLELIRTFRERDKDWHRESRKRQGGHHVAMGRYIERKERETLRLLDEYLAPMEPLPAGPVL